MSKFAIHNHPVIYHSLSRECPVEFLPLTKFYISWTNIGRNMGTSLKDAETLQVFSRVRSSLLTPTQWKAWQMDWERGFL